MLSETNLRGTVDDRINWLRYMAEQCVALADDIHRLNLSFAGFCWYPYIDSTDWNSLVCEARRDIDPQGIYWLDRSLTGTRLSFPRSTPALAKGTMRPGDIPARHYSRGALEDRGVGNYLSQMPWLPGVAQTRPKVPLRAKVGLGRALRLEGAVSRQDGP
jgi:hypothetical protein